MRTRYLLFTLLFSLQYFTLFSQATNDYKWWNPAQHDFPVVEGQAWPEEVASPYDRFPARAEKTVREAVWNLSRHGAGLMIRFRSNSSEIKVRYGVSGNHAMPHMPATGVSGVDLYAISSDGDWLWCAGKYSFGDTISFNFANLTPNDAYHKMGREYRLYLPLYNHVEWLEIGVPDSVIFTPLPVRMENPVVVYGTSIAQGGCASRPGMAWTAILGRKIDRPVINLAFSGNGRMEEEVVDLLVEIDPKLYVLDCLPNMTFGRFTADEVISRTVTSVHQLRQKHPDIPILMTDHAGYTDGLINAERKSAYQQVNQAAQAAFTQLKSEGVENLYLLPIEDIHLDIETTVDGTHPNDVGMMRYAEAYENKIREILHEPVGTYTTMQPCTQYREPNNYDWEARHREILELNKNNPPRIAFFGNSITHFWGGKPAGPRSNGKDSWDQYLEPMGVRNFGYGWDRIENVLWRVYHGELDGFDAEQVVMMIGTNNMHLNTDEEILAGLKLLIQEIQVRQPTAKVLILGIYPRRQLEPRIVDLNQEIAQLTGTLNVRYTNPGITLLKDDGTIDESLFSDGLHPNAAGYQKLGKFIQPYLIRSEEHSSR